MFSFQQLRAFHTFRKQSALQSVLIMIQFVMWNYVYCISYRIQYNIMRIMLFAADFGEFFIFMLNNQVHIFHSSAVFCAG